MELSTQQFLDSVSNPNTRKEYFGAELMDVTQEAESLTHQQI
jgi:hypothetical protein